MNDIDYFNFFGLSPSFNLDKNYLKKQYLTLQAKYHPDSGEKDSSSKSGELDRAKIASQLNEGYQLLNDELKRAEYLLKLKTGTDLTKEEGEAKPSFELLNNMLVQREELEETEQSEALEELLGKHRNDFEEITDKLSDLFDKEQYEQAIQPTLELKYKYKIIEDIKAKLKQINTG